MKREKNFFEIFCWLVIVCDMLKFTGGRGANNCVKTRGGTLFLNSLQKSLYVNEVVRKRALKERGCAEPVRCNTENNKNRSVMNKQDTIGNFSRIEPANFGHKVRRSFGLERPPAIDSVPDVPLRFFCLPNFDLQIEQDTVNEPHWYEDHGEFFFVDPKKN